MRYVLEIDTFDLGSGKDKARKVTEEAAEVFSAWEALDWRVRHGGHIVTSDDRWSELGSAPHVLYECMDVVQAASNIMAALGATQEDVDAAGDAMEAHNRERGRYGR